MSRFHPTGCTSAVNNNTIRDNSRGDSSLLQPNYSLNPRRPPQLTAYKLRCDKDPLNSRLGPPDFHPQTPNCPEETLTREYVQSGYRETVEGLEESREISLSQVPNLTKPVILKCKEAIRKCHRAINESRAQKRKAGQVYGVPLSGALLSKHNIFPDQRPSGEEFRKKWIEGLSQPHKRLRTLADHVPHGYRRKSLFEVLIRNNVPLLRATWFIKITYLNQVRPGSSSISSGVSDRAQVSRSEQWTKDVIEYLQTLLDEFVSRSNSNVTSSIRDRSQQMVYDNSVQHKSESASLSMSNEEPSLCFKWWYMVRILQWHHAEGLLIPPLVIDWILNQLQEKELLGVLQLLLPIIYSVLETLVLSQAYVRTLVGKAIRFIREPSPGGSDLVDNSRRAYTTSALVEMLRYLILVVPDTFVALDCFPLPSCIITHAVNDGSLLPKVAEDGRKMKNIMLDVSSLLRDKGFESQSESLSIKHNVSSIQKCIENLATATTPGYQGHNEAKALQALDKALMHGDLRIAYTYLFQNLCDGAVHERWLLEVSSCLRTSLKYIGGMSLSFICSIFLLCEWATCDFRDFRTSPPRGVKFTGRKDFSQVYVAVRLLEMKLKDINGSPLHKKDSITRTIKFGKDSGQAINHSGSVSGGRFHEYTSIGKVADAKRNTSIDLFESPSAIHDILVCWIEQHEVQNGEGFKRLHLLIIELVRAGIFYPTAYVRQLIVSGIMDENGPPDHLERRKRHHKILKQLPGPYIHDAMGEAQIAEPSILLEAVNVYSNERRLVLGLLDHYKTSLADSDRKRKHYRSLGGDSASSPSVDQWRPVQPMSSLLSKSGRADETEGLKASVSVLLQLPSSLSKDSEIDESQGGVKRTTSLSSNRLDLGEGTPGCEECRRAKRQKVSEERSLYYPGYLPADDEEIWWVKKVPKSAESFKVDAPPKPIKQTSRGRQKSVRKTQSLAQLASARIEGSQGASTSHVCDSKVNCPHHKTSVEGDVPKSGGIRTPKYGDVVSIGKALKKLRFDEKRTIMVWLMAVVKQLLEEAEKTAPKVGHYGRPLSTVDDRSSLPWKLGEDELSSILYLMDVSNELVLAAKFLIWLLPKVLSSPGSSTHGARNILMLPKNPENHICEVGETFLLSSIRRCENILVAASLIPETLTAAMNRAATFIASNGRVLGSPVFIYARQLLKKYGNLSDVIEWEKNFKSTGDKRLIAELESGRALDGEFAFPLGVPAGVEDLDEFFRQKITGVRVSRVGLNMRDIVQRHIDEALHYLYGKDKKIFVSSTIKGPGLEKWDDGYQIAQQTVMGLMDCMRQTGGAAQEGDPTLVSSAISAIIGNAAQVLGKIPDLGVNNNHLNISSASSSLHFARRIIRIHLTCLCLLKEALGERQSRVFEVALATEASSALLQVFAPGKAPRSQFQSSPESHDPNANFSNDYANNSTKTVLGRASKIAAAVSALVIGSVIQGIASLERMVALFRLREGLDVIQFVRSTRSNSNGNARSLGAFKVDNLVEVSVHWFRVLVGNCRTVSDGFVVELLGETSMVALARMQRMLPLSLVLQPAYSIFAFVVWKPFIFNASSLGPRDDIHQLHQSLALAINDAIKHIPFREICLRDTRAFYDIIAADAVDSEFAATLESNASDANLKNAAFVPLRARLFLNALIDCNMPQPMFKHDDGIRATVQSDSKVQFAENEMKLLDKLVHVLDSVQPAKFHWQWVELRLLLNEQAITEKLGGHDTSLVDAIRSLSPNPEKAAASDNESNFIEIILTRLLVRPDAAPLFSEVVHLLGRSLEDSMLLQAKWFLGGHDVLYGRKSIRQRLVNIAQSKGLSIKAPYWRPWGWCQPSPNPLRNEGDKRKNEVSSLEEGEVVDEGVDSKRSATVVEGFIINQQQVTERALIELVLPCVDQGSDDSRTTFASDMIKQMNNIEQQITAVMRGANKLGGTVSSENTANKGSSRKGMRGGSPGLARRAAGPTDTVPPSPAALRASMSLRLQFLLRLLPIICVDGEPSGRNMRHSFASIILRLLGSRVVHEEIGHSFNPSGSSSRREAESPIDSSASGSTVLPRDGLFDRLLLVLHGLLSSHQPGWLKFRSSSKLAMEHSKFAAFDREVAENLQNELDKMQLPDSIRWRIQTAMPILSPSVRWSISCQPPSVSLTALAALQPSNLISVLSPSNPSPSQRNLVPTFRTASSNVTGKTKAPPQQPDFDLEYDPWTLLEDGAGSGQSSTNPTAVSGSDHANMRAASLLKGAVRVRRTDLAYIGAIDDDS